MSRDATLSTEQAGAAKGILAVTDTNEITFSTPDNTQVGIFRTSSNERVMACSLTGYTAELMKAELGIFEAPCQATSDIIVGFLFGNRSEKQRFVSLENMFLMGMKDIPQLQPTLVAYVRSQNFYIELDRYLAQKNIDLRKYYRQIIGLLENTDPGQFCVYQNAALSKENVKALYKIFTDVTKKAGCLNEIGFFELLFDPEFEISFIPSKLQFDGFHTATINEKEVKFHKDVIIVIRCKNQTNKPAEYYIAPSEFHRYIRDGVNFQGYDGCRRVNHITYRGHTEEDHNRHGGFKFDSDLRCGSSLFPGLFYVDTSNESYELSAPADPNKPYAVVLGIPLTKEQVLDAIEQRKQGKIAPLPHTQSPTTTRPSLHSHELDDDVIDALTHRPSLGTDVSPVFLDRSFKVYIEKEHSELKDFHCFVYSINVSGASREIQCQCNTLRLLDESFYDNLDRSGYQGEGKEKDYFIFGSFGSNRAKVTAYIYKSRSYESYLAICKIIMLASFRKLTRLFPFLEDIASGKIALPIQDSALGMIMPRTTQAQARTAKDLSAEVAAANFSNASALQAMFSSGAAKATTAQGEPAKYTATANRNNMTTEEPLPRL